MTLGRRAFLDRYDMQRIYCGHRIVFTDNHCNSLAERDEIRVRHPQPLAAGKLQRKRFEPVLQ